MEELIKSPCIRVCKMDNSTGLCTGCLRTMDEIAEWIFLTEGEKLKLLTKLDKRRQHLNNSQKISPIENRSD